MKNPEIWITIVLLYGGLLLVFPGHVRRLMGWWYGFSGKGDPMPDWFHRKWSDSYVRAFGLLALVLGLVGVYLKLKGTL